MLQLLRKDTGFAVLAMKLQYRHTPRAFNPFTCLPVMASALDCVPVFQPRKSLGVYKLLLTSHYIELYRARNVIS